MRKILKTSALKGKALKLPNSTAKILILALPDEIESAELVSKWDIIENLLMTP